ncbi:MAG: NUDIX hydrolase [Deltaproteobacteria bacterium]|nr:NUDIX hydrolase [Deltaproteobacteria bacterium]
MNDHGPDRKKAFRFCPSCGGELGWTVIRKTEPPRLKCRRCGFVFYLDPKVAACTVIDRDGSILLVRRAIPPEIGKWVVPGGFVDLMEPVEAAAVRETREEANIDVSIDRLLGVYSYPDSEVVVVVYTARWDHGEIEAGDEVSEARLFAYDAVPWDDLAFRSTEDALRDYLNFKGA